MKLDPIITDFLGGLPETAALNAIRVTKIMESVPEHHERIKTILELTGHPDVTVEEFQERLKAQESVLLEAIKKRPEILIKKPLSGKNLNIIKDFTPLWSIHAIYWAYRFDINFDDEILSDYNPRIGDIALKNLEYFHKMKKKEEESGDNKHLFSFYEFIATGKVRAIEFLVRASHESNYLNKLYLDIDDGIDLDTNFFHIQNTNRWESESLQVVKAGGRNIMKYENEDEGLSFQIVSSRMLKDGSLDSFEDAEHKTLQLYALEGANHNSKYRSRLKGASSSSSVRIIPVVEELEEELMPLVKNTSRTILADESGEMEGFSRRYRREYAKVHTKKIPKAIESDSDYARHRRNRSMSAKIAKNALLLPSAYDNPPIKHLRSFIAYTLIDLEEQKKILFGLFVLGIMLGGSFEEMMKFLRGKKSSLYALDEKKNKLKTKLDGNIFAERVSDTLDDAKREITFHIPHLMGMLIAWLKNELKSDSRADEQLHEEFVLFIKQATKKFPKRITIKPSKLYTVLKAYAKDHTNDLLSSCFATGTYLPAEKAKLAYTSTRKESSTHSVLLNNLWVALELDGVARKLLGNLKEDIFATTLLEIPAIEFAGSSSCVSAAKSAEFFTTLEQNFADLPSDSDEAFNIASIYVRYATTLLIGTRNFMGSSNFDSCSLEKRVMMISEKSESVPAGIRVIPMCSKIANLLSFYDEHFLKPRSLSRDVWLLKDQNYVLYKPKTAHSILETMSNLKNRSLLMQYVQQVPLNSGRHCFTRKALELEVPTHFISAYLGHYFAGAEQFGIYSTMDIPSYIDLVTEVTAFMADEFGIKDTLC